MPAQTLLQAFPPLLPFLLHFPAVLRLIFPVSLSPQTPLPPLRQARLQKRSQPLPAQTLLQAFPPLLPFLLHFPAVLRLIFPVSLSPQTPLPPLRQARLQKRSQPLPAQTLLQAFPPLLPFLLHFPAVLRLIFPVSLSPQTPLPPLRQARLQKRSQPLPAQTLLQAFPPLLPFLLHFPAVLRLIFPVSLSPQTPLPPLRQARLQKRSQPSPVRTLLQAFPPLPHFLLRFSAVLRLIFPVPLFPQTPLPPLRQARLQKHSQPSPVQTLLQAFPPLLPFPLHFPAVLRLIFPAPLSPQMLLPPLRQAPM